MKLKQQHENHSKMSLKVFLRTHNTGKYSDIVVDILQSYKVMGCNMSSNVRFVDCHLNLFLENFRTVNYEHGERFYQDISPKERQYRGKWTVSMLADYCWTLRRDILHA